MRSELNYRTFVVANPAAAAGAVGQEWDFIERLLRARLPEVDAAFTEGPGHATLLTREALRAGWEMIVCVGGDGTLNEVLNGFFERPDPEAAYRLEEGWVRPRDGHAAGSEDSTLRPVNEEAVLGVMPMGTGGDFRRSVGLMGGLTETADHLSGRGVRPIDVGEIAYLNYENELEVRYFLNIASAGFAGLVDRYANEAWKGLGGPISFLAATARAFTKWKNTEIEAVLDDTVELSGKMFNLVVANGEFFGGGMWVAPGAGLDDGKFQVVEMADLTKRQVLGLVPRIYRGRHLELDTIGRYQASRIAARTADPEVCVDLDVDGETPGKLPAYWRNHAESVRLKF